MMGENENTTEFSLSPEEEFRGHCSNLQAWVENDYNTNILHNNLAFPLLHRLTEVGDKLAQRVFKNEVYLRFSTGKMPAIIMLIESNYLDTSEIENMFTDAQIVKNLLSLFKNENTDNRQILLDFFKWDNNFIISNFFVIIKNFGPQEISSLLMHLNIHFIPKSQWYDDEFLMKLLSFLIDKYKKLSTDDDKISKLKPWYRIINSWDRIESFLYIMDDKFFPEIEYEERRIDYGLFNYMTKNFYDKNGIHFRMRYHNGRMIFTLQPHNKLYSYDVELKSWQKEFSKNQIQMFNDIKNALFGNELVIINDIEFITDSYYEEEEDREYKEFKNELQIFVLILPKIEIDKFEKNITLLLQASMEILDKIRIFYKIIRNHFLVLNKSAIETRIIEKDQFYFKLINFYEKNGCEAILKFSHPTVFKIRQKKKKYYTYIDGSKMSSEVKKIFFSSENLNIGYIHEVGTFIQISVEFDH